MLTCDISQKQNLGGNTSLSFKNLKCARGSMTTKFSFGDSLYESYLYKPKLSLVLVPYRDKVSHENPLNENFCGNHRAVMSRKVPL